MFIFSHPIYLGYLFVWFNFVSITNFHNAITCLIFNMVVPLRQQHRFNSRANAKLLISIINFYFSCRKPILNKIHSLHSSNFLSSNLLLPSHLVSVWLKTHISPWSVYLLLSAFWQSITHNVFSYLYRSHTYTVTYEVLSS